MKVDPLVQAYEEWVELFPGREEMPPQRVSYFREVFGENRSEERIFIEPTRLDGKCCEFDHWMKAPGSRILRPKRDHAVCAREKAWRKYCRIRDSGSDVQ